MNRPARSEQRPFEANRTLSFALGLLYFLAPTVLGSIRPVTDRNAAIKPLVQLVESGRTLVPHPPTGRSDADLDGSILLHAPAETVIPQAWEAQIKKDIVASEYNINFQEQANAYQSPNRAQDLRITYRTDGFSMTPRVADSAWTVDLAVEHIGREDELYMPDTAASLSASGRTLIADHGLFTMEYRNDEEGMRQDFRVLRKPMGAGPLEVRLQPTTNLDPVDKGGNAILFCKANADTDALDGQVWYNDLAVTDAEGTELVASMHLEDGDIIIRVDDVHAEYPILIDPLSSTANWTVEGNQLNARLGWSLGTAGDVNGDGYSDAIVGAPFYDFPENNEGAIFIYHGSASGLSASYSAIRDADIADYAFGYSVSTAGDVNGDGYSDVMAIEEGTSVNNGRLFIYHGSSTGIGAAPAMIIPLLDGLVFWNLACAGDVNNDGYSDIMYGAPFYNAPLSQSGRVWIHHGSSSGVVSTAARILSGAQADGRFGNDMACAGDINGDGCSDIVIGQLFWTAGAFLNQGRVFVYYGVPMTGIGATPGWSYVHGLDHAYVGSQVACAGDVNADGFSDIVVAAVGYANGESQEGAVMIFHGSAGGLAASPDWFKESDLSTAFFGSSVSTAGDVNGDGFADVIIGASGQDGAFTDQGGAYLFYGGAGGLATTAGWVVVGGQANCTLGATVAIAGDVNGDGYSDVIVGAPTYDNSPNDEGKVWAYYGAPNGLGSTTSRSGPQADANLGASVGSAGDVNGDGFSDVIVGAPLFDNGQTNEGRAYVYLGSLAGPSGSASWNTEGNQISAQYGYAVGSAGDVNGDGYCEALVAAPYFDFGQNNEGRAFVYHGSSSGLPTTATLTIESDQPNAQLGMSLGTAGDVNGDGYGDIIIGIPLWDGGETDEGRAVVHFGSNAGLIATPGWSAESDQAGAQFGLSVAMAGDVYTDGYGDVVVGAPLYDNPLLDEGRVFVYYGTPSGPATFITWSADGNQASAQFGISVSTAGDVNGDGKPDLIIGANLFDNGQTNEGRAFVYHGSGTGLPVAPNWTAENNVPNSQFGYSVANAGDVNGDGYGDVVMGAHLSGNGRIYSYYGSATGLGSLTGYTSAGAWSGEQLAISVSGAGDTDGDGFGDVIAGAPFYDQIFGSSNVGRMVVYFGNSSALSKRTRQYRSNLTTPVQPGNGTFDGACTFGIGQVARSWMGRRNAKLAWEIRGHAPPYNGSPFTNSTFFTGSSATWTPITGTNGVEIKELLNWTSGSYPRWRVRVRHHPATMIDGQVYGRWHYFGMHDEADPSVKIAYPDCGLLPVALISFTGHCDHGSAILEWTTASEQNSDHFLLERSDDLRTWTVIDRIQAAGHSQGTIRYSAQDDTPLATQAYYRLAQLDMDGTTRFHGEVAVDGCLHSNGTLSAFPNPTTGLLNITLHEAALDGVSAIEVHNATGQIVLRSSITITERQGRGTVDLSSVGSGVYFISVAGVAGSERVAIFKD